MTKLHQIKVRKKPDKKVSMGFYSVTGCAGCLLSVIFNEDEILDLVRLVDLKAFPFVKEVNIEDKFDYVFIEGLVADNDDLEVVKKLRKKAKKVVSLGACSGTGCVPAYRQFTLKENYAHLLYKKQERVKDLEPTPVDAHVRVDHYIPGCPPDKQEIVTFIKNVALGKEPRPYESPVCIECRMNGNQCLLDLGKPCLGPITQGGCHAVCINGGLECWGCRGPTKDMNLPLMIKMLKDRGFDDQFIQDRMRTFVGLKMPMIEEYLKSEGKANKLATTFEGKKDYFE